MAALLIVLLIAVALPASADVGGGGASRAPAGNASAVKAGIGNSSAAGNVSRDEQWFWRRDRRHQSGPGVSGIGPDSGFDRWGWNLPGGIAAGPVSGYGGHGHGALWNFWNPYPGNFRP